MKLINQNGLLIVISLLLLTSLIANLFLYKELKFVYLSWYETSLNPLSIPKYNHHQQEKTNEKQKIVVFFGDSRSVSWSKPELEGFQFINRGINGQTSAQVRLRFDAHVATLQPEIIIVQVGINDLRMLPQSPKTREDIVQNCQNNISNIIKQANKIGATVIVTTIFPLGNGSIPWEKRLFWPKINQIQEEINQVNSYIKTLEDKAIIFDAYSLLELTTETKQKYYKDLLHLNGHGYLLLNQKLSETLRAL